MIGLATCLPVHTLSVHSLNVFWVSGFGGRPSFSSPSFQTVTLLQQCAANISPSPTRLLYVWMYTLNSVRASVPTFPSFFFQPPSIWDRVEFNQLQLICVIWTNAESVLLFIVNVSLTGDKGFNTDCRQRPHFKIIKNKWSAHLSFLVHVCCVAHRCYCSCMFLWLQLSHM